MSDYLIKSIDKLLSKNIGDKARLEHIKETLEKEKDLYNSDEKYVQNLIDEHLDNENIVEENRENTSKNNKSSDLEEKLQEAEEKINKLEKQSEKQEERDYRQTFYKSEGTTLVLSIVLGLLGINGIGQIYVGRVGRGVAILLGSIVLFAVGIATVAIVVGIVLLVIYFVIFIWQIIDARRLCQEFNRHVRETGKRPW